MAGVRKRRLLKSVVKGKPTLNLYLITLPTFGSNMLDITRAVEFKQKVYSETDVYTVGIATGAEEAKEIVRTIVEDMYDKTGRLDIREFFGSRFTDKIK